MGFPLHFIHWIFRCSYYNSSLIAFFLSFSILFLILFVVRLMVIFIISKEVVLVKKAKPTNYIWRRRRRRRPNSKRKRFSFYYYLYSTPHRFSSVHFAFCSAILFWFCWAVIWLFVWIKRTIYNEHLLFESRKTQTWNVWKFIQMTMLTRLCRSLAVSVCALPYLYDMNKKSSNWNRMPNQVKLKGINWKDQKP